jgi:hypothetical protein
VVLPLNRLIMNEMEERVNHVVLLGDSIFDNVSYVPDGLPVIDLLRQALPGNWQATLLAVDGSVCANVHEQIDCLAETTSCVVISCGGNDALQASGIVQEPVETVGDALLRLADMRAEFRTQYRRLLDAAQRACPHVAVCTIYEAIPDLTRDLQTALAFFNEVILCEAAKSKLPVIDLRVICDSPADFSTVSSIEPSEQGGRKIASAISRLVSGGESWPRSSLMFI